MKYLGTLRTYRVIIKALRESESNSELAKVKGLCGQIGTVSARNAKEALRNASNKYALNQNELEVELK